MVESCEWCCRVGLVSESSGCIQGLHLKVFDGSRAGRFGIRENEVANELQVYRELPRCSRSESGKPLPDRQPIRRPELYRRGNCLVTPNHLKAIYGLTGRPRIHSQKLVHESFDRHMSEKLTIREASELLVELKKDSNVARPTACADHVRGSHMIGPSSVFQTCKTQRSGTVGVSA